MRLAAQQNVILEQRRAARVEERSLHAATHHPVTGLPNRALSDPVSAAGHRQLARRVG